MQFKTMDTPDTQFWVDVRSISTMPLSKAQPPPSKAPTTPSKAPTSIYGLAIMVYIVVSVAGACFNITQVADMICDTVLDSTFILACILSIKGELITKASLHRFIISTYMSISMLLICFNWTLVSIMTHNTSTNATFISMCIALVATYYHILVVMAITTLVPLVIKAAQWCILNVILYRAVTFFLIGIIIGYKIHNTELIGCKK
jgi:hypothetical protein